MLKSGKGEKAERRHYREELIVEILTGITADQYVTREMQWGIDQEIFARAAYEMAREVMVGTAGFFLHPNIARFGASPDGLVGEDGLVQIKCPTTATHLNWILDGRLPDEHVPQMLAELSCTGRKWNDFVSFDPRLPKHLQLFIRRFHREEPLIALLEAEVEHFNSEIQDIIDQLPQAPAGQPIANILDYLPIDELIV